MNEAWAVVVDTLVFRWPRAACCRSRCNTFRNSLSLTGYESQCTAKIPVAKCNVLSHGDKVSCAPKAPAHYDFYPHWKESDMNIKMVCFSLTLLTMLLDFIFLHDDISQWQCVLAECMSGFPLLSKLASSVLLVPKVNSDFKSETRRARKKQQLHLREGRSNAMAFLLKLVLHQGWNFYLSCAAMWTLPCLLLWQTTLCSQRAICRGS